MAQPARQPDVPALAAEAVGPICALLDAAIIRLELLPPTARVAAVAAAYRDRLAGLAQRALCLAAVSGDDNEIDSGTRDQTKATISMQKTDFTKAVAEKAGVEQKNAKIIIDSALDVIAETLVRGEKVTLTRIRHL